MTTERTIKICGKEGPTQAFLEKIVHCVEGTSLCTARKDNAVCIGVKVVVIPKYQTITAT